MEEKKIEATAEELQKGIWLRTGRKHTIQMVRDTDFLSESQLKKISGASDVLVKTYQPELNREMKTKGIDTKLKKAHFLAQLCAESGCLKYTEEIANGEAYEGRRDLGNVEPEDGRKFKGRGLIQITGRVNYTSFGSYCGENFTTGENYKKVAQPKFAVLSAIWYWSSRNLNALAEQDDFLQITFKVNGGFNGIGERAAYLKKGYEVFGVSDLKTRLDSIIPPIKANLDKVLPLVDQAIKEKSDLNNASAAKSLFKQKKISLYERLLFVAMDSEASINSFKTNLGI